MKLGGRDVEELNVNSGSEKLIVNLDEDSNAAKMGFFQRVIGVIVSPSETMKDLIAKPRVLFATLLTALSMLGLYLIRFQMYKDFMKTTMELTLANSNKQLTPEQIQSAMPITVITGLIGTPIGSVLAWIVGAAILFGLIKLFKGEGKFKQYLAITGYAYVIMFLYILLSAIVSFFSGSLLLDSSVTNITNLFLPDLKGTYVYGVLRGIDFFTIWHYIVIGIGITLVSKLSKPKVYSIILIIYIASILIGANNLKLM